MLIELSRIWPRPAPCSAEKVEAFADLMRQGVRFPPIQVSPLDGLPGLFQITNGAHRAAAAACLGYTHVRAEVRC
jgi:hypothetical protein